MSSQTLQTTSLRLMTGLGLASTRLFTAPRMATLSGGYWSCYHHHHRVNLGFPTFFVQVRAHRGEPHNKAADRIASTATRDEDVHLLWNAPSGRIIYHFTPDPCESEDTLYTASMNDTVKKFIKIQTALSTLYPSRSSGIT